MRDDVAILKGKGIFKIALNRAIDFYREHQRDAFSVLTATFSRDLSSWPTHFYFGKA
jgi:hypothetical protein